VPFNESYRIHGALAVGDCVFHSLSGSQVDATAEELLRGNRVGTGFLVRQPHSEALAATA